MHVTRVESLEVGTLDKTTKSRAMQALFFQCYTFNSHKHVFPFQK